MVLRAKKQILSANTHSVTLTAYLLRNGEDIGSIEKGNATYWPSGSALRIELASPQGLA